MDYCAGGHIGILSRSSFPFAIAGELRSLNNLPNEILLKILSHFGPEDLCFIIANVCERWNALSKDVALWKTLSYSCDKTSDISRVVQVLTVAPALQSLIISGGKDVARILGTVIDRHVDIRKLVLESCYLGEDGTGLLTNVLTLSPDLEALSLDQCHPLRSAAYSLIPHLKKLTELNLSLYEKLSGEMVRLIVDSCQHLKKLSLDGVELFDDDVIHVIEKLGKQLTTLLLHGGSLTDAAYLYLNKCARLQELRVLNCREITDRGLLEGIGSLQELTSLRLMNGRNLTAQALSTFLHQSSMTSMVLLELSYCYNLDDVGLKGIAKRCEQLKELVVRGCKNVSDDGISMVIRGCSQLCVLDFTSLNITGNGWFPLVPAFLPHLRKFSLSFCDTVCDEYIEELAAAAPELHVKYTRGSYLIDVKELNKKMQ